MSDKSPDASTHTMIPAAESADPCHSGRSSPAAVPGRLPFLGEVSDFSLGALLMGSP